MTTMPRTTLSSSSPIADILGRTLRGDELSAGAALKLFEVSGKEFESLLSVANEVRRLRVGDTITFVDVRNINFTNICHTGCRFCGFARPSDSPEAFELSLEEIAACAREAWERGATEVCMQGGIHPGMKGSDYVAILRAVKEAAPEIHIHAFSPFEILYGAERDRISVEEHLKRLKDAGLGSIPGTAAEIFDEEIRREICPSKIGTEEWFEVVSAAHRLGIPSTATMMFGHRESPRHWIDHLSRLRELQRSTRGFTEFVPLPFVHLESPLFREGAARPGPTREECLKVHAVARLFFQGLIDNIQVSWVKLGPAFAGEILEAGANDFGGTLMEESISRTAGAAFGESMRPTDFVGHIRALGRLPARRDTLYKVIERYSISRELVTGGEAVRG